MAQQRATPVRAAPAAPTAEASRESAAVQQLEGEAWWSNPSEMLAHGDGAGRRRPAVFDAIVIPGITARLPERPAPASEVLQ
jgi:hypothetical protein